MEINMDFSEALNLVVHTGGKISRDGWNGRGMYVVHQNGYPDGIGINANTAEAVGLPEGTVCSFRPYLMFRTVDGEFVPWVASQTDLLATDWTWTNEAEPEPLSPDLRERAREWIEGFHEAAEDDQVNTVALLLAAAEDAYQCAAQGHKSGIRLALPYRPGNRPAVRVYDRDYEVSGWDFDRGSQVDGVNASLRLKLDFI